MAILANPYRPGSRPPYLAGRDDQTQQLQRHVSTLLAFGTSPGRPLVFYGPRGVGKTSLLWEGRQLVQSHGLIVAWVSCSRGRPFLADAVDAVGLALERVGVRSDKPGGWKERSLAAEVGIPPVGKVSAEFTRGHDVPGARPEISIGGVERVLYDAAHAAREHGGGNGGGLVLAIDELHAAHIDDVGILLNAMQNLDVDETAFAFVGAGLPSVRGHLTRAATFGERASFVEVGTLTEDEAGEALTRPAEQLGIHWSSWALEHVVEVSHCYPQFIQEMGSATWDVASPTAGTTLTREMAEEASRIGHAAFNELYAARWDASTDTEKAVMRVMADLGGEEPVSRAAVEERLGGKDISMVRARLIEKSVIRSDVRGTVQFTLPGFAAYVSGLE